MLIPVSEIAGSVSPKSGPIQQDGIVLDPKTKTTEKSQKAQLARALTLLLAGISPVALALPSGGHVQHGQAQIQVNGNNLTVDQGTQKAIINWQKFGIKPNESVNFNQPSLSSITLNRVIGNNPSQIMGHLSANGQIFLVNPSGITFGKNASVDAGGIVASTLNITNKNFLNNNYQFQGSSTNSVINKGSIKANNGGSVAFIGHQVNNQGQISTPGGTTALGAGQRVDLTLSSNHLLHFAVKQSALQASVKNGGLIKANHGGKVVLTAHAKNAALKTVVNNKGVIRAHSVKKQQGHIALLGGKFGTTKVSGTLDASASKNASNSNNTSKPNQKINGGTIETSGAHVKIANNSQITTKGQNGGLDGIWTIDPKNFTIAKSGGDITGTNLSSKLNSNSVQIKSSQGANGSNGNIYVNAPISWSGHTLKLFAINNININAPITVKNEGSLNLFYGQGSSSSNNNSQYNINAKVNLTPSDHFATQLGTNGTYHRYTIIDKLGRQGNYKTGNSNQAPHALRGISEHKKPRVSYGSYALGSDINASNTNPSKGGTLFKPIGTGSSPFKSSFNGLGHTIKNLHVKKGSATNAGLFGVIKNTGPYGKKQNIVIRDLGIQNAHIQGGLATGGLAGKLEKGVTVKNVYVTGTIQGGSNSTGGLVGSNLNSTIQNSYTRTQVNGYNTNTYQGIGGLVGKNSGTIKNSYATGLVNGQTNVGGLIGQNTSNGTVSNVYATGKITGTNYQGGLIGSNNSNASITNAYWDTKTAGVNNGTGNSNSNGISGKSTASLMSTNGTSLKFTQKTQGNSNNWVIVDQNGTLNNANSSSGATLPMLASEYSHNIQNAHQLQLMAMNPKANYDLAHNFNASATGLATNSKQPSIWSPNGFVPIGYKGSNFKGKINGHNKIISGLVINRSSQNNIGLLGKTRGATIKNIGLSQGSITGQNNVGGLIGFNSNTIVHNDHSYINVTGQNNIGGLVGKNTQSSFIKQSYARGQVTGTTDVGGLVGYNNTNNSLVNVYATGNVQAKGTNNQNLIAGGLVGLNQGKIGNAYATSHLNIIANSNSSTNGHASVEAGGLVGFNSSSANINQTYTTGSVSLSGSNNQNIALGDLVGLNYGSIQNTYVDGTIHNKGSSNGTVNIGALVGHNNSNASINNGFWDKTTDKASNRSGVGNSNNSNVQAKTTKALASNLPSGFQSSNWANAQGRTTPFLKANTGLNSLSGFVILKNNNNISPKHYNVITNTRQLQNIQKTGLGLNYVLGHNINAKLTGFNHGYWNKKGFAPIGPSFTHAFTGSFNGLGYTINNLTINRTHRITVGLFGYVKNGTVKNLGLKNINIKGSNTVGGIASTLRKGATIQNDYTTGHIFAVDGNAGGLIGYNQNSTINDAYSTAKVVEKSLKSFAFPRNIGGLVGNNNGTIKNSYATGSVVRGNAVGGLIGTNSSNAKVSNVYATGQITTSNQGTYKHYNGGLIGKNNSGSSVTHAYWDTNTTGLSQGVGNSNSNGVVGKSTSALMSTSGTSLNFTSTPNLSGNNWVLIDKNGSLNNANSASGSTLPMLASEYSHNIQNTHQLQLINMKPGVQYKLEQNINAKTTGSASSNKIPNVWGTNGFVPIGNKGKLFTGKLIGQNHAISHLTINRAGQNNIGLFGKVSNATIQNIKIASGQITGQNNVGGLIGYNSNTSIKNVNVFESITGQNNVGGLIGNNAQSSPVHLSSAGGQVSGTNHVGGLIGLNHAGNSLKNVYANGNIQAKGTNNKTIIVGGLVGSNKSRISNAYSAGNLNITANSNSGTSNQLAIEAGGLVGHNASNATISQAYTTGSINLSGSNNQGLAIGNLIGSNYGSIQNTYVDGTIHNKGSSNGIVNIGALVGQNNGASISNSFWDKTTDTVSNRSGVGNSNNSNVQAKTTKALASNLPSSFQSSNWANTQGKTTPYLQANTQFNSVSGSVIIGSNSNTSPIHYGLIQNTQQLQNIQTTGLGLNYLLGNNIDASKTSGWNLNRGFKPIGINSSHPFKGQFNGFGYTIKNLTINQFGSNNIGLFGSVKSGSIYNLNIANEYVNGKHNVGGLIGNNKNSSIHNISMNGTIHGDIGVGGLIGKNSNAIVTSNFANITIKGNVIHEYGVLFGLGSGADGGNGSSKKIGGLIGIDTGSNSIIKNDHTTGRIEGRESIGGLIGFNKKGLVSNSYSSAHILALYGSGGLIGFNKNATVKKSHATGNIDLINANSNSNMGGFIGTNKSSNSNKKVINDYATGTVVSIRNSAGFIAYNEGIVSNSYATGKVTSPHLGFMYYGAAAASNFAGFVAYNTNYKNYHGKILNDYATGNVIATIPGTNGTNKSYYTSNSTNNAGLVASNYGVVKNSHATGNVISDGSLNGGLIAYNEPLNTGKNPIKNDYATGKVISKGATNGGLIGSNYSSVVDSYATGNVISRYGTSGGLIGYSTNSNAILKNDHATGSVTSTNGSGTLGGLVGSNYTGTISNSYATGNVTTSNYKNTSNFTSNVGGLVGTEYAYGSNPSLINSYATGKVSGKTNVGGLIGTTSNSNIKISNDYATGNVQGKFDVGGLIGSNYGVNISNSYAKGSVTAIGSGYKSYLYDQGIGGLIGYNNGNLTHVHATGNVTNKVNNLGSKDTITGGLVGTNTSNSTIKIAYATGKVTITSSSNKKNIVGGLVGKNQGFVSNAYAKGNINVSGHSNQNEISGGLIGSNGSNGKIIHAYSTSSLTVNSSNTKSSNTNIAAIQTGGLVGHNKNKITNAYADGAISSSGSSNGSVVTGAIIGSNTSNAVIDPVYWDTTTAVVNSPIGTNKASSSNTHITGLTNSNMQQQSSFKGFDFTKKPVWKIYNGHTKPLLNVFLTPLTISGGPSSNLTYGKTVAQVLPYFTYSKSVSLSSGHIKAQIGSATTSNGNKIQTGTYNPFFYSNQQGYNITNHASALTISKKQLNLSSSFVNNPTKIYNGNSSITISKGNIKVSGFQGSQSSYKSTNQVNGSFAQSGAGSKISVSAPISTNDFSINSNVNLSNYKFPSTVKGTGTIKPKQLTASFANAPTKTYNGTNGATIASGNINLNGFIGSQGASASTQQVSGTYAQSNAGSNIKVSANISSNNFNPNSNTTLSNYKVPNSVSGTGAIKPKQLNANIINNPTKVYNGTNGATIAQGNATLSGFVGNQGASASTQQLSGHYDQSSAGTNIPIKAKINKNDFNANNNTSFSNYKLPNVATGLGTIKPKNLTISSSFINNPKKIYNGNSSITISKGNIKISGFQGSQSSYKSTNQVNGSFAQSSAGSNIPVSAPISTNNFSINSNVNLSNYKFPSTVKGTGTIKPKQLTAHIINNPTKTYNGTNGTTINSGNVNLSGFVGNQGASTSTQSVTGNYSQANAGSNIKMSAVLNGSDFKANSNTSFANYKIPSHSTSHSINHFKGTGTIQPKQLTASFANAPTKTYNGTNGATIASGNINLNGFIGSQGASASTQQLSGHYAQSNAGHNIKVSANLSSSSFNANSNTILSNYKVPNSVSGKGTIKPKQLNANIINNPTKVYDGQPNILIPSGDTQLNGFVGNQGAQSNPIQGHFVQSKPGQNIKIITNSLKPNDFQFNSNTVSNNYVIPNTAQGTGTIKQYEYKTGSQPNNQQHAAMNQANQLNSHRNNNHSNTQQSKQSSRQISRKICIKEPGSNNGSKETVSSLLNIVNGGINEPQGVSQKIITIHTGSTISGSGSIKTRCFKPKQ